MADYVKTLKEDLVEQFKGKPNIESLMEVIGIELQQVFEFFEQLRNERWLYSAVGKQLDGVGDIVCMTRMEAAQLAGKTLPFDTSDDEAYRQYLIYKILKNTCECTYDSLMTGIQMFWKGNAVSYREDPDIPATIILDIKGFSESGNISGLLQVPIIKAAGVGVLMETHTEINGPFYIGAIHQEDIESKWAVEAYEIDVLVDEDGNILTDENNDVFIDTDE